MSGNFSSLKSFSFFHSSRLRSKEEEEHYRNEDLKSIDFFSIFTKNRTRGRTMEMGARGVSLLCAFHRLIFHVFIFANINVLDERPHGKVSIYLFLLYKSFPLNFHCNFSQASHKRAAKYPRHLNALLHQH